MGASTKERGELKNSNKYNFPKFQKYLYRPVDLTVTDKEGTTMSYETRQTSAYSKRTNVSKLHVNHHKEINDDSYLQSVGPLYKIL